MRDKFVSCFYIAEKKRNKMQRFGHDNAYGKKKNKIFSKKKKNN